MRFLPTPLTSASFFISFSIISKVFSLNTVTIRSEVTGPIPLIRPEPRYLAIPETVTG